MESEFFGHKKGSVTVAVANKAGLFQAADGGTLFLDEIGELPIALQAKILRVLQEKQFERLGGTRTMNADVRILAATNINFEEAIGKGTFRSDLYYRLNVISIHIPPLRDRMEDIAPLCEHFLKKHSALNGNAEIKINGGILEQMHRYAWPGNIRELENTLKSFSVLRDEESFFAKLRNQDAIADSVSGLVPEHIVPLATGYSGEPIARLPVKEVTKMAARKAETDTILDVLSYTRWNRRKTASLLKISYKALLNKIKEYEIEDRYRKLVRPSTSSGLQDGGQTTEDRGQMTTRSWQATAGSRQKI